MPRRILGELNPAGCLREGAWPYNGPMNTATDLDYARYDHIRPILWTGDALQLLDQRKLPFVVEHVAVSYTHLTLPTKA